jgi:biotin transport system substrate-specific component
MKIQKKAADVAFCGLFAALIAIGAFLKIPIPPVPVTLQTFFAVLAGLLLGRRRGATAAGVYLVIGLVGLPVFTAGGGISYLLHPTFGYLLGLIPCAYLVGWIAEKDKTFLCMLSASAVGMLAVYVAGVPYLYLASRLFTQTPMGITAILTAGFLTPLPGDILKVVIAAYFAVRVKAVLH